MVSRSLRESFSRLATRWLSVEGEREKCVATWMRGLTAMPEDVIQAARNVKAEFADQTAEDV